MTYYEPYSNLYWDCSSSLYLQMHNRLQNMTKSKQEELKKKKKKRSHCILDGQNKMNWNEMEYKVPKGAEYLHNISALFWSQG